MIMFKYTKIFVGSVIGVKVLRKIFKRKKVRKNMVQILLEPMRTKSNVPRQK